MAVVDIITEYDGQTYFPGDTLPDLGSLVCVSVEGGKRSYMETAAQDMGTIVVSAAYIKLLNDGTVQLVPRP